MTPDNGAYDPSGRTPEWRGELNRALAACQADEIDAAMQWAYDVGVQAGMDYAYLVLKEAANIHAETGTDSVTTRQDWSPANGT